MAGIERVQANVNEFQAQSLIKKEKENYVASSAPASAPSAPTSKPESGTKTNKQDGLQQKADPQGASSALTQRLGQTETGAAFRDGFKALGEGIKSLRKQPEVASTMPSTAPPVEMAKQIVSNNTVDKEKIENNKSGTTVQLEQSQKAAKSGETKNTTVADQNAVKPVDQQLKDTPTASGAPTSIAAPTEPNQGDKESSMLKPAAKPLGEVKSAAEFLNDNIAALRKAQVTQPKPEEATAAAGAPSQA